MKRSKWGGLWNNSDKHYMVSLPIKIDDLKQFVDGDTFRIIIKKNKFYQKDSDRPYYCFAIGDDYSASSKEISSYDMQYDEFNKPNDYVYTYQELRDVMHQANYDGANGITDIIVGDYIDER